MNYILTNKYKRIKTNISRLAAFGLSFSMAMNLSFFPAHAASSHGRIGDNTYQLKDGTPVSGIFARGIDVSHWQGPIDWQQVSQNDISFVMLGTRYDGQVDPRFHINAAEAAMAGVQLGIYIYSYATDVAMAEAEADFVLNLIKDYPISYPVAFDVEASVQSTLTPTELADIVNAFCRKVEEAGYHAILYANDYWLANKIDMSQVNYDVWVARYETPHAFENPVMWQATSTGSVDGITGNVDIDFQFRDFSDVIAPNLWRTIGGNTYYYQNHQMQKDTWIHDGTGWFFMDNDGLAVSGWFAQNEQIYYLDPSSRRMTVGWLSFPEGWRYFDNSGAMQTGWIHDGSAWYYLNTDALMQTGWLSDNNLWYYLQPSGAMANGWQFINGIWYYLDNSGAMQTGRQQIQDKWYYFDNSGAMQTGLIQLGESWYYFGESGAMATGRQQIQDKWYYFNDTDGTMATGWKQIDGLWYYYGSDGQMQTGWVNDSSARYYLNPENGVMYADTQITVDGVTYQVDASGACQELIPETETIPDETSGSNSDNSEQAPDSIPEQIPNVMAPESQAPILQGPGVS